MSVAENPPCAGAIFDMDGLLFDTETLGRRAWGEALARFGYALSDELYLTLVGRDMAWRQRLLTEHYGPELPFEEVKRLRLELGEAQERAGALALKAGARELVTALHSGGVPLVVATGTERRRALRRLRQAQLAECFQAVITSEDVAQGKPAPDIFLTAAARLGIPAQRCLVFEDSCAGVTAAAAAGARVVLVPDMEPADPVTPLAAHVLPDLRAALELIPQWFGRPM